MGLQICPEKMEATINLSSFTLVMMMMVMMMMVMMMMVMMMVMMMTLIFTVATVDGAKSL